MYKNLKHEWISILKGLDTKKHIKISRVFPFNI